MELHQNFENQEKTKIWWTTNLEKILYSRIILVKWKFRLSNRNKILFDFFTWIEAWLKRIKILGSKFSLVTLFNWNDRTVQCTYNQILKIRNFNYSERCVMFFKYLFIKILKLIIFWEFRGLKSFFHTLVLLNFLFV